MFRMKESNIDTYCCDRLQRCEPTPPGCRKIESVKPQTWQYSYSNEKSQGALICQTGGFPSWFNPKTHLIHSAYSDRMAGWDRDRFRRACELAGGGDQVWAYRLPSLSDQKLREFAQVALNLDSLPIHVRVIHWFNVATGYSCPTVEAIVALAKLPEES